MHCYKFIIIFMHFDEYVFVVLLSSENILIISWKYEAMRISEFK